MLGSAAVWRARALDLKGRLYQQAGESAAADQAWRSALEIAKDTDTALASQLSAALDSLTGIQIRAAEAGLQPRRT